MQFPGSQLLLLLVAPFIGSFLGVVIERLPTRRQLLIARSQCDHCAATLDACDLIPVISWFASGGRCRHCGARLGWFYPLVELAALGVAVWTVMVVPGWLIWPTAGFGWTLLALGWVDQRRYLLPDALTLPLAVAGMLVVWLIGSVPVIDHVIGAVVGFLALSAVASLYRALRHRDGLGGGDAKLFGAIGAWVGWQGLPTVILYAAVSGILWVLARRARGKPLDLAARLPFGPHLCLAGWLVWLYGPLLAG